MIGAVRFLFEYFAALPTNVCPTEARYLVALAILCHCPIAFSTLFLLRTRPIQQLSLSVHIACHAAVTAFLASIAISKATYFALKGAVVSPGL